LGRRFYWIGGGQTKDWRFRDASEAADFVRANIDRRMKGYGGRTYQRLPRGVRIYD
jgi:hypothetical protein